MANLSVNLDKVAALREMQRRGEPDPCQAAVLAELAGADGIAVQLHRHRKNIRDRDLYMLKGIVKTRLTVEMPPIDETIEKALEVKPWMVIFVADHADSDSPVSPIDFNVVSIDFGDVTSRLNGVGVNTGFLVEPDPDEIKGATKAGASTVMLDCSRYTEARTVEEAQSELDRIDRAAQSAARSGLTVYCSRGINYKNVRPLAELGTIDDFIIGHAICARAMLVGFDTAVKEMLPLLQTMVQSN